MTILATAGEGVKLRSMMNITNSSMLDIVKQTQDKSFEKIWNGEKSDCGVSGVYPRCYVGHVREGAGPWPVSLFFPNVGPEDAGDYAFRIGLKPNDCRTCDVHRLVAFSKRGMIKSCINIENHSYW